MTLATARLLVGRTIVAVDLRPYPDGRGGRAYNPVLTLDNGATVTFEVQDTDVHGELDGLPFHESGDPGVRPDYKAGSQTQVRRAERARSAARQAVNAMLAGPVGEGDSVGLTGNDLRGAQALLRGRLP